MPRPDRGVAQRYAARKRKKRAAPSRVSGSVAEPIRSIEGPDAAALPTRVVSPLPRSEPRRAAPIGAASPIARPRTGSRRPFSSYADDYRYVFGDLRRVALVAGSLLLALIVLSFFIR
jgi:hypothetical protein